MAEPSLSTMTTVCAPGSSANLGPGFDVLGVAIGRHAWVSDSGPDGEQCPPGHLATTAYEAAGGTGPIWFGFDLRPGRGMGFSGAARAASAVLAFVQQGFDIDTARDRAYPIVSALEGHGDNAAPSVFGGLHIVAGLVHHRTTATLPGRLILWVPDVQSSTDESRSQLPSMVPMGDAVFNLGRVALLMAALYESDAALLGRAVDDRLHQPARFAGLADSARVHRSALTAGASAAWLSGSGPSVAILTPDDRADAVTSAVEAAAPGAGDVMAVDVDLDGARVVDGAQVVD